MANVPFAKMRVLKRYAPEQDGAKRLALRHGEALVCVRHRLDPAGDIRYTTVELVVDRWPIRTLPKVLVQLRIGAGEKRTRAALMSQGGVWSATKRLWIVPRSAAQRLGLLGRAVPPEN